MMLPESRSRLLRATVVRVYTLGEIGEALGGRTPATVSYGFQKIAAQLGRDKQLSGIIKSIQEELNE